MICPRAASPQRRNEMTDIIKLNGVSVDVEEARKAIAEFDAWKAEAEKLYDGLTLEQWKFVIDGKFLCELWDGEHRGECSTDGWAILLDRVANGGLFYAKGSSGWYEHCRPAQVYGVRHPCFGKRPEWLHDGDRIIYVVRNNGNSTTFGVATVKNCDWSDYKEFIAMPAGGKIE